jgi:hypothetical protein
MKIDKAAFPSHASEGWEESGMTLRDYFAGQALIGFGQSEAELCPPENLTVVIAKSAYQIADAMLAEREKQNDGGKE